VTITPSALRRDLYRLLDQVLESGQALEVECKGELLQIVPKKRPSKMSRLVRHPCLTGDPESIVHLDWSQEWRHDLP